MGKKIRIMLDKTVGAGTRYVVRHIASSVFAVMYKVTLDVDQKAYMVKDGALIFPNHVSMLDAPLLMSLAWDYARLRPVAKYEEYEKWYQKWAMLAFGALRVGSPRHFSPEDRRKIAAESWSVMTSVAANKWGVPIFPQGKILPFGAPIDAKNRGAYDLVREFPHLPVLMVTIEGLEYKRTDGRPVSGKFFRRPVSVRVRVFEKVDPGPSVSEFNSRLEDHWYTGTPL